MNGTPKRTNTSVLFWKWKVLRSHRYVPFVGWMEYTDVMIALGGPSSVATAVGLPMNLPHFTALTNGPVNSLKPHHSTW